MSAGFAADFLLCCNSADVQIYKAPEALADATIHQFTARALRSERHVISSSSALLPRRRTALLAIADCAAEELASDALDDTFAPCLAIGCRSVEHVGADQNGLAT